MPKNSTDCLIVGAGPVGLTLACQLQYYGVDFRIIDKLDQPVIRTKAAAVWSRTTELLAQIGLDGDFLNGGLHCFSGNLFADGKRFAQLPLDTVDSLYNFVIMIPQHATERILADRLAEHDVKVEYGRELTSLRSTGDQVTVELTDGDALTCRWVVGCDGAHSGVRHALGLDFSGEKLESGWVVADAYLDDVALEDEIMAVMHDSGPTALFPLGDMFYRIVAQVDHDDSPRNADSAESALRTLFDQRVQDLAKLGEVKDAGYFNIHERQVERYQVGPVFVAGDAAHVHSPLGGQGMNTGMHDAFNLGWKLALVARGQMKEELLGTYHDERFPIGRNLVKATSMATKMITQRQPLVAALRKQAAKIVTQLPVFKHKARDVLAEVDIHYREGPLSLEPEHCPRAWRFKKGVRAGERAPDATVLVDGAESRLMNHIHGARFHLLVFGGEEDDCWSVFKPLVESARTRYGSLVQIVWIGTDESKPPCADGEVHLIDHTEELHHDYAATEPSVYLLRPDGYVAYRSQSLDAQELGRYFQQWRAE